jgi:hypothetical protein
MPNTEPRKRTGQRVFTYKLGVTRTSASSFDLKARTEIARVEADVEASRGSIGKQTRS